MKRRKPPKKIFNAGPSGTEARPAGVCRSCGKASRALRCPACHKAFEIWCSDTGEPAETAEAYVPRNRWSDGE